MVAPSSTRAAPRAASVWPSEDGDSLACAGRSDAVACQHVLDRLMQRLRNRAQFQAVLAGPPVAKTAHFALHRAGLDGEHEGRVLFSSVDTWLGVMLPKRWARRAVTRNTIRRQIYEVARALPVDGLPPAAWVVRLRGEFSRKHFVSATSEPLKRAVRSELQQLLGRMLPRSAVREPSHVA